MANMTQKGSSFVLEWLPQTGSQPSKKHTDVHTPTANLGTVNIILTHLLAFSFWRMRTAGFMAGVSNRQIIIQSGGSSCVQADGELLKKCLQMGRDKLLMV